MDVSYSRIWASQVALVEKNLPASSGDVRDAASILELGRSPEGGHGTPLQCSSLENPWTEELGGLQFRGSQRVGHNWSNLAKYILKMSNTEREVFHSQSHPSYDYRVEDRRGLCIKSGKYSCLWIELAGTALWSYQPFSLKWFMKWPAASDLWNNYGS